MKTHVTFTRGGDTITINGPVDPSEVKMLPMWASVLTQGLARFVYRGTDRYVEQWTLTFDDLTGDDWAALRDFFKNIAQGPSNPFTYTHTDDESYTAWFVDTDLVAQRRNSNSFSTRVVLELLGQQVNGTSTSTTTTTTPGP